MIEACFECEEVAEGNESLDCDHKKYRYSNEHKKRIPFIGKNKQLEFGEPV